MRILLLLYWRRRPIIDVLFGNGYTAPLKSEPPISHNKAEGGHEKDRKQRSSAENALRIKPKDEEALRDEQIKRLKQKVGELVLDLDILKKANKSCAFRVMAHIRSRQTLAPEFFHFRRIIYRNVEY